MNRADLIKTILALFLSAAVMPPAFASQVTWVASSPDDNMNDPANWSTNTVPVDGDEAVFNSAIPGISTHPVEQSVDFTVSSVHFQNNASDFEIAVKNRFLELTGEGITGKHTDAAFNLTNIDNADGLGNQLIVRGPNSTIGSAQVFILNKYTLTGSAAGQNLGFISDAQLRADHNISLLNECSLTVENKGVTTGINNSSDFTSLIVGGQIYVSENVSMGDGVQLSFLNEGVCEGTNNYNNWTGYVSENGQLYLENNLSAGDDLIIHGSNNGLDSSYAGSGRNFSGILDTSSGYHGNQIEIKGACSLGDRGTISLFNSGNFSGAKIYAGSNAGSVARNQFYVAGAFSAGDDFRLNLSNTGNNSASSLGSDAIGAVSSCQGFFGSTFYVGDRAEITLANSGIFTGSATSSGNYTGSLGGEQLRVNDILLAGDRFKLVAKNSGYWKSSDQGGGWTGYNASQGQVVLNGCALGDNASIAIENSGKHEGAVVNAVQIGDFPSGQQFVCQRAFLAGDNLHLAVSNSGEDTSGAIGGNYVGTMGGGSQIHFGDGCTIGSHAAITLKNSGTNSGTTENSRIGTIAESQLKVSGAFQAGSGSSITASNQSVNTGSLTNVTGLVGSSQILFEDTCTLGNGSTVYAFNDGSVSVSQISLKQGYSVPEGKVKFHAANGGEVGMHGIHVEGLSLGGNANIMLENSSLYIDTEGTTFNIGELNGDATSIAQSSPLLVIATDSGTRADFAGSIMDFPEEESSLYKTGPGTQKLSGTNSYTGVTTVNEGTLIISGSVDSLVLVDPSGILKGSGTINNSVFNSGTISPGESIGTMSIIGNFTNNGGNYFVEVASGGRSDLVSATGIAEIDGGNVVVGTVDGTYTFQHPYTIVEAAGVTGAFTQAVAVSPMIEPMLTYDPSHIYLTLQTAIQNVAKTHNQQAVAERLDALTNLSPNQSLLLSELVDLSPDSARDALDSLSGYQHTDDILTAQMVSRQFIRRLYDPLRRIVTKECLSCFDPCGENEWDLWLTTGGNHSHIDGAQSTHKRHINSFEITAGLQKTFCCDLTIGLAGGYEYDSIHYNRNGSGKNHNWLGGLYGLYRPDNYYVLVDAAYGYSKNDIDRGIVVGPLRYKARSSPNISQTIGYAEAGFDLDVGCFLVQPFAGIQVARYWRDGVTEKEPYGWGLSLHKKNWTATNSRVGLHLSADGVCDCTSVSVDVAWNQLLSCNNNTIVGRFTNFGDCYTIKGEKIGRSSVDYALTISSCIFNDVRAYLEFSGESWQHMNTFNVIAGVDISW